MHSACIGVFDSGVGGLSVLAALRAQLPGVALRYIADSAHAPYGERPAAFVIERSLALAAQLVDEGAGLLVIACNTATALAAGAVRERFPQLPVVGIEPGVKPAAAASRNGRVGVLATRGTLDSERFARLITEHGGDARFTLVACDGVAAAIERGELDSPPLRELVARYSAPLRDAGVDVALLGCTHYPLIRPLWQAALPGVQLLQVEPAVAAQAARRWTGGNNATDGTRGSGGLHLASTGNPAALRRIAEACGIR